MLQTFTRRIQDMFNRSASRIGVGILTAVLCMATLAQFVPVVQAQTAFSRAIGWASTGKLVFSDTAPTIASGFGTTPSISSSNGATVFRVNVGTGGSATSGVITMPTASNGWGCVVQDQTTNVATRQTATTATTVTVTAASAWTASDILVLICGAY